MFLDSKWIEVVVEEIETSDEIIGTNYPYLFATGDILVERCIPFTLEHNKVKVSIVLLKPLASLI